MIWQPKPGQEAIINYKDKSMEWQGVDCRVITVGIGPGPKNVLVETAEDCVVIPRGNLVTSN